MTAPASTILSATTLSATTLAATTLAATTGAATTLAADRYVSFRGIDFDGHCRALIETIERYHAGEGAREPFWGWFLDLRRNDPAKRDDLLLLSSLVNPLRERFEAHGDADALALLERAEEECF